MTRKQILEKAIKKAIDGGCEEPYLYTNLAKWQAKELDGEGCLNFYQMVYEPPFNFAKALWGDSMQDYIEGKLLAGWQIHLQNMVIAEDPIAYLGEHLQ